MSSAMFIRPAKQANYIVVENATAEAYARAKEAPANRCRIQDNGLIVIHKMYADWFEVAPTPQPEPVAPTMDNRDEWDSWVWDHLSTGIARYLTTSAISKTIWNEKRAGKTVSELEEAYSFYK